MRWRVNSLRARLQILGILAALFLIGSAISFGLLLRNTQAQLLAQSVSRVQSAAETLAKDYVSRAQFEHSPILDSTAADRQDADEVLSLMTTVALRREFGTEGGFYSASADRLVGYAFPTHEGPGVKKDMPQKELPTILDLARKAVSTQQAQSLVFRGAHDAIVFEAEPIIVSGKAVGSSWTMRRLPGVESDQRWTAFAGFGVLALGAGICVSLAFLLARGLGVGVAGIEARLQALESDLSAPPMTPSPVAEIGRIDAGIERLASALRDRLVKERELETRLRDSERLAALGKVAAGVAHELRNPLSTIRLRTQLSQRESSDSAIQRNSNLVLAEVVRLDRMVERLLYFSRPVRMERQPVSLHDLLFHSVETHARGAGKVTLRVLECNPGLHVSVDASAFQQVIDNLIRNAVESLGDESGDVWVSARLQDDNRAAIEVSDTGPGIAAEDLPHVFDPFFSTKAAGTGLGLSICYEIVKAHGGDVNIRNGDDRGCTVTILLPVIPAEKAQNNPSLEMQA